MAIDGSRTPPFHFQLHYADPGCAARRSVFTTPHGAVQLPAFMPVGTQASVKGLTVDALDACGVEMILANTYHLTLRPGEEVIREAGGLHSFTGWPGPILTDSGGFQLFSLAKNTQITDQAAVFRSHIDGRRLELSPEKAVRIQEALGADVAMVLDHVTPLPRDDETVRDACERTIRWARRCREAARRPDQAQFAIVQGGLDERLRVECAERLVAMDFPGYAVGGLSVGEPVEAMYRILQRVCPALPDNRPRYLMGVGRPADILEAIRWGIDLFDCVMPTRNGRNALAFTDAGPLRLRNQRHARDDRPIQPDCPCAACRHSRAYLRHLFMAQEMLGPILLSMHNVTYYQRLMQDARQAITDGRFMAFYIEKMRGWGELEKRPDLLG